MHQFENSSPPYSGSLNHEEFVPLLLQNGASLNAMDQDKITPIEEGLMRKWITSFKTMIAYAQYWNQKMWYMMV